MKCVKISEIDTQEKLNAMIDREERFYVESDILSKDRNKDD